MVCRRGTGPRELRLFHRPSDPFLAGTTDQDGTRYLGHRVQPARRRRIRDLLLRDRPRHRTLGRPLQPQVDRHHRHHPVVPDDRPVGHRALLSAAIRLPGGCRRRRSDPVAFRLLVVGRSFPAAEAGARGGHLQRRRHCGHRSRLSARRQRHRLGDLARQRRIAAPRRTLGLAPRDGGGRPARIAGRAAHGLCAGARETPRVTSGDAHRGLGALQDPRQRIWLCVRRLRRHHDHRVRRDDLDA